MAFETLIENGVRRIVEGRASFSETLQSIPELPEEFVYAAEQVRLDGPVSEENDPLLAADDLDLTLAPDEDFPDYDSAIQGGPITGSAVFSTKARQPASEDQLLGKPMAKPERKSRIYDGSPNGISRSVSEEKGNGKPAAPAPATLLVIDDDPDQRSILRKVFELEGYRVETASDGVDGIVSANRIQPTVIIVDFMMPDLDGRETIQRLKASPATAEIPIVALTAYADPDVEFGLLKAGADDFCAKSVSKKVLLRRIQRLVSG
jgi:CheY-like chemotaxis protein